MMWRVGASALLIRGTCVVRDYIHELPRKLKYLRDYPTKRSWDEFAKFTKIPKSTFDQVRDVTNDVTYSRMGEGHQRKLAKLFGFTIDLAVWRNRALADEVRAGRSDTAEAFILWHQKHVGSVEAATKGPDGVESPSGTDASHASTVRDTSEYLKEGRRRRPETQMGALAQVKIEPGQPGQGSTDIVAELSCHGTNIRGSKRVFTLRHVVFRVECGEAQGARDSLLGINGEEVPLTGPYGTVVFAWCGNTSELQWTVTTDGALIGTVFFSAGIVKDVAHGDVLRASLRTWLKFIQPGEDPAHEPYGIIDPKTRELLQINEQEMTIEQSRFIEHLNKLTLRSDNNGYVEVASHELELVRK